MRSSAGFEITEWASGRKMPVTIPAGARVSSPVWSPDGTQFAFLALFEDGTQIYVADATTGKSRAVTTRSTLSTSVTAPEWTADGTSIVTVLVPDARGPEPKEPKLATGPMVRLNENNKLKTRTYPDLLASPFEKALLAYHTTGQLAVVTVKTRAVTKSSDRPRSSCSRCIGCRFASFENRKAVPHHTPWAPRDSAAARPRPSAMPPAATTGTAPAISTKLMPLATISKCFCVGIFSSTCSMRVWM